MSESSHTACSPSVAKPSRGSDFPRESDIRTALLAVPALALTVLTACSSDAAPRGAASPDPVTPAADLLSPGPGNSDTGGSDPSSPVATSPGPAPSPTATAGTADPAGIPADPGASVPSESAPATPLPSRSAQGPDDPLAPGPPLESAPPVGVPTCAAAALTVTDADAVYGSVYVQQLFTVRTTGPDCQLAGTYPAVSVLDAAGAALGSVGQGGYGLPAPGGVPVTLSRTTSLSFFVASKRDGSCLPATTLVVTLPGTASPLRAGTGMQVCDRALGVGPVQRLGDDE